MFENIEIYETIYHYEGVVETYRKKTTRSDANRAGISRKMTGGANLLKISDDISSCTGKHQKIYVDCTSYRSKLTCMFHDTEHSSDQCKFLNDFGAMYSTVRIFKGIRNEPTFP